MAPRRTVGRATPRPPLLLLGLALLAGCAGLAAGLRGVRVEAPASMTAGDLVALHCVFDLEGHDLYTLSWYKGYLEFFRYAPAATVPKRGFSVAGIEVDVYSSNETSVVFRAMDAAAGDIYSCEVSETAPSFHTLHATVNISFGEPPLHKPVLMGVYAKYRVGDELRARCRAPQKQPHARLVMLINGKPVDSVHLRKLEAPGGAAPRTLEMRLQLGARHFAADGRLRLRCVASLPSALFQETAEATAQLAADAPTPPPPPRQPPWSRPPDADPTDTWPGNGAPSALAPPLPLLPALPALPLFAPSLLLFALLRLRLSLFTAG